MKHNRPISSCLLIAVLAAATWLACSVMPGAAHATPPGNPGAGPIAVGSGHLYHPVDGSLRTFTFAAIQLPNGTVSGQIHIHNRFSGVQIHVAVNCAEYIDDATVILSGVVTWTNGVDVELLGYSILGETSIMAVQDGGPGGVDQVTLAGISNVDFPGSVDPLGDIDCSNISSLGINLADFLVESFGNVTVWPQ